MEPTQGSPKISLNPFVWVGLGIVILVVVGGIWYVIGQGKGNTNTANTNENTNTAIAVNTNEAGNANINAANANVADPYAGWETYSNAYYGFSLRIPPDTRFCLTGLCTTGESEETLREFQDKQIGFFRIEYVSSGIGSDYLEILPRKSNTGMTAGEFGELLLSLNRTNSQSGASYSGERAVVFKGNSGFDFIATNGLEERGIEESNQNGASVLVRSDLFVEKAGSGILLANPHKVIYFDRGEYLYRIIYPINNPETQAIIDSFTFSSP